MKQQRRGQRKGRKAVSEHQPHRRRLLAFTEGKITEPEYIRYWYGIHRERVFVQIHDYRGVDPMSLVERAVQQRRDDLREQKRGRGDEWDEYWCVFDRDAHTKFDEAIRLAESNQICVACSNPCIELWFMLHLKEQYSHIERGSAQREVYGLLGCNKNLGRDALASLEEKFKVAKDRAQALDRKHQGDGSPPRSNPSSNVWQLVESITQA
ncbi:RloB family protein [Candidatus Poriferisodalis sp.]|uniref:RloB family protein n=1 Tax=Candidatus Poriferisodalis sp. TaxID=3101277 RepID=UPI003B010999